MRPKVGDILFRVCPGFNKGDKPLCGTACVTWVGRKYFKATHTYKPYHTYEHTERYHVHDWRSTNTWRQARLYPTQEDYETELKRDKLASDICLFFDDRAAVSSLNLNQLSRIQAILDEPALKDEAKSLGKTLTFADVKIGQSFKFVERGCSYVKSTKNSYITIRGGDPASMRIKVTEPSRKIFGIYLDSQDTRPMTTKHEKH